MISSQQKTIRMTGRLSSLFILVLTIYGSVYGDVLSRANIDKIRGSRIVGGENTTIEAFPHQASLHFFHQHLCGATIVSQRWVVSAAHCTTLDLRFSHTPIRGFSVRVGTTRLEQDGQQISVLRVYDHPTFLLTPPVGFDYDITLLYLERDLVYSTTIQPLRLPETDEIYESGTVATVIGWGVTDENGWAFPEILQKVDVPLITNEYCESSYNTWGIINYVTDRMICAGYDEGQRDACGGDSGGPLITNNTLIGVVSWGNGCARENTPGVYANVRVLRSWIREITGL